MYSYECLALANYSMYYYINKGKGLVELIMRLDDDII